MDHAETSPDPKPSEEEENLLLGAMAGFAAVILGAAVWTGVAVATRHQFGWIAIGVGFLVGFSVRTFGKGASYAFGFVGALFAFVGCWLGNVVSACGLVAVQQAAPFLSTLLLLSLPTAFAELMHLVFSPIDLLVYALATYVGYRYSFSSA